MAMNANTSLNSGILGVAQEMKRRASVRDPGQTEERADSKAVGNLVSSTALGVDDAAAAPGVEQTSSDSAPTPSSTTAASSVGRLLSAFKSPNADIGSSTTGRIAPMETVKEEPRSSDTSAKPLASTLVDMQRPSLEAVDSLSAGCARWKRYGALIYGIYVRNCVDCFRSPDHGEETQTKYAGGSGKDMNPDCVDKYCRGRVIHPESLFRFRWTIALAFTLLYIAIVVPVQMGFRIEPHGLWKLWEYLVDVFFILDVTINFLTGYTTDEGTIEMRPGRVARNYLSSVWFPIDFITSIPFDWVKDSMSGDLDHLKMAKIFRALKAMKVLRLNRLLRGSIVERIEDAVMQSSTMRFSLKMTKLLVGMLFAFHWCACIMHMTASPKDENWIRSYLSTYDEGRYDIDRMPTIDMIPLSTRYLVSVYWTCATMSTVGYGDIVPTSNMERGVTFAMMIVGGSLYGFLIGNMNSIVHDVDANTRQYNRRMESILSYMNSRRFPNELQRKVIRYYRRYFKSQSALDEKTVLAELSTKLKTEVAHFLIDGLVFQHPVFQDLGPTQLATLTTVLKPMFFDADDYLVRASEPITDVLILAAGKAHAYHADTEDFERLGHGDSFGEEALVNDGDEHMLWQISVVATSVCEAMLVPVEELRKAFQQTQNSKAIESVKEKCRSLDNLTERLKQKAREQREQTAEEKKEDSPTKQRKNLLRSKFKRAVTKQKLIGMLGSSSIKMRPDEKPEDLLRRTVVLKAKEMDRGRNATAQGAGMSVEKGKEMSEDIQRLTKDIEAVKAGQKEMERKLAENTALLRSILDAVQQTG